MPVYNCANYLMESIESILNQTYENLELIIINDGSTDNSVSIVNQYKDIRIKLIHNLTNMGISELLNIGLKTSSGKYIARMDGDDISEPNRLFCQYEFLENHPEISIIGTSAILINRNGKKIGTIHVPQNSFEINWELFFRSPFIHPSIMMRREIFLDQKIYYSKDFPYAEDYDIWTNILKDHLGMNLGDHLLRYRIDSEENNRILFRKTQVESAISISSRKISGFYKNCFFDNSIPIGISIFMNNYEKFVEEKYIENYLSFVCVCNLFKDYSKKNKLIQHTKFRSGFTNRMVWKIRKINSAKKILNCLDHLSSIDKFFFFHFLLSIPRQIFESIRKLKYSHSKFINY